MLALSDIHASEAGELGKMGETLELVDALGQMAGGDEAVELY